MIVNFINLRPPSLNTLYRTLRGGRIYKSTRYKDVLKCVEDQFKPFNVIPLKQKLKVKVFIYLKTRRQMDVDNCVKWLDCLNKLVWVDDTQIYKMTIQKEMECLEDKIILKIYDYGTNKLIDDNKFDIVFQLNKNL